MSEPDVQTVCEIFPGLIKDRQKEDWGGGGGYHGHVYTCLCLDSNVYINQYTTSNHSHVTLKEYVTTLQITYTILYRPDGLTVGGGNLRCVVS